MKHKIKKGIKPNEFYISLDKVNRDYGGKPPAGARPTNTGNGYYVPKGNRRGRKEIESRESAKDEKDAKESTESTGTDLALPEAPDTSVPGASSDAPKVGEPQEPSSLLAGAPKEPASPKDENVIDTEGEDVTNESDSPPEEPPKDQPKDTRVATARANKTSDAPEKAKKDNKATADKFKDKQELFNYAKDLIPEKDRAEAAKQARAAGEHEFADILEGKKTSESPKSKKEGKPKDAATEKLKATAHKERAKFTQNKISEQLKDESIAPERRKALEEAKAQLDSHTNLSESPTPEQKAQLTAARSLANTHSVESAPKKAAAKKEKASKEREAKKVEAQKEKESKVQAKAKERAAKQAVKDKERNSKLELKDRAKAEKEQAKNASDKEVHHSKAEKLSRQLDEIANSDTLSGDTKTKIDQLKKVALKHQDISGDLSDTHKQELASALSDVKQAKASASTDQKNARNSQVHSRKADKTSQIIDQYLNDPNISDENKAKLTEIKDKLSEHKDLKAVEDTHKDELKDITDQVKATGKEASAEAKARAKQEKVSPEMQKLRIDSHKQRAAKLQTSLEEHLANPDLSPKKKAVAEQALASLKEHHSVVDAPSKDQKAQIREIQNIVTGLKEPKAPKPGDEAMPGSGEGSKGSVLDAAKEGARMGQQVERAAESPRSSELTNTGLTYGGTGAVKLGHHLLGGEEEDTRKSTLFLSTNNFNKAVSSSSYSSAMDTDNPEQTAEDYDNSFDRRPVGVAGANPISDDPDKGRRWKHAAEPEEEEEADEIEDENMDKAMSMLYQLFDKVQAPKTSQLSNSEIDFLNKNGYDVKLVRKGLSPRQRAEYSEWLCSTAISSSLRLLGSE